MKERRVYLLVYADGVAQKRNHPPTLQRQKGTQIEVQTQAPKRRSHIIHTHTPPFISIRRPLFSH